MAVQRIPFTLFEPFESGRRRSFKFDTNALADFEQEVGMGFPTLMASRAVFAATRALTWSGLKHADRGLTLARVGELIQAHLDAGGQITDILEQAMKAAIDQGALKHMRQDVDEDEQEPEPTPRGSEGNGPRPTSGPMNSPSEGSAGSHGSNEPSPSPTEKSDSVPGNSAA